MRSPQETSGRSRVVIEDVQPSVDHGRFPVKRVVGERVVVEADAFADGHGRVECQVLYKHSTDTQWHESPMLPLGNDRWRGEFMVAKLGEYEFTVEGWEDAFLTWRGDLRKRLQVGQDIGVEILIGAKLVEEAVQRASGPDAEQLNGFLKLLQDGSEVEQRNSAALDPALASLMRHYADRRLATRFRKTLPVTVDRPKAEFSAWYEIFPRSCSPVEGTHGTLRDCANRLPYVASMGFDVLYLPPIHPIGEKFRKGKNNVVTAEPADVGSPWAIGAATGGHKSIHPDLGTIEDFDHLVEAAKEFGIEVALDIAFQCAPDHPYVREHPEWFRKRPDGTVQYAENPPKKYQDIYPFDFECEDWQGLWQELKSVFLFWVEHGVKIFRVDNPHTKPLPFWEWVIREIKREHPDVIFLAEAFTRPKVMKRLAKAGFSQSYTYFTWRNTKQELTEYFKELTEGNASEYFRPNLWPNTPDILPEGLQVGGRGAFMFRFVLASTLGANYGIYGPAFELCENTPREPGSEEYLHSEKYELKHRDLNWEWSLKEFIARVNSIRKANPALHSNRRLTFHETDNPLVICYSKTTEDFANVILVAVNLDPFHKQSGWVTLSLDSLGIESDQVFQAHDLITGSRFVWQGPRNYLELMPVTSPAHVMLLRKRVRTEQDFDYYF